MSADVRTEEVQILLLAVSFAEFFTYTLSAVLKFVKIYTTALT